MSAAAVATGANGLREVRLYGHLRAKFGRSHWLAVESPAEALRALCALFKGFREALQAHRGPGYRVLVGEGDATKARDADTLSLGTSAPVIRIAPVIHGAKKSGVLQTIIGIALIIGGLLVAPFNPALGAAMVQAGVTMVVAGVVKMLSPQKDGKGNGVDSESSYLFSGGANVISPGGPVPLVIGRFVCGSTQVSAGIATDEMPLASNLPSTPPRPGTEPADLQDDYVVGSP